MRPVYKRNRSTSGVTFHRLHLPGVYVGWTSALGQLSILYITVLRKQIVHIKRTVKSKRKGL